MKLKQASIAAIAIVLLSLLPFKASAQFRYAPIVGVNINNLNFKQDLVTIGQTVGATAGIQLSLIHI